MYQYYNSTFSNNLCNSAGFVAYAYQSFISITTGIFSGSVTGLGGLSNYTAGFIAVVY